MPVRGVACVRGLIPLEEHYKCMTEQNGPPCGISPTILQMITEHDAERIRENVVFSPSSISSCHRQHTLSSKNDWFIPVKNAYKSTRGSIFHQGLGQEPAYPGVLGVVRELRMGAQIDTAYGEKTFHGKPDEVVLLNVDTELLPLGVLNWHRLHVKITDYKTRGDVGHDLVAADRRHVVQINQYAWLVKKFLPQWLTRLNEVGWAEVSEKEAREYGHLYLNGGIIPPRIDEVIVDELSIEYLDMSKARAFSSRGFLYAEGKMVTDLVGGRYVRRKPVEYEELELEPIYQFKDKYIEGMIRKGIEAQIESDTLLARPMYGDDARLMCGGCGVRQVCYELGRQEGYGMEDQRPYVNVNIATTNPS
jgi:hypothetical protein